MEKILPKKWNIKIPLNYNIKKKKLLNNYIKNIEYNINIKKNNIEKSKLFNIKNFSSYLNYEKFLFLKKNKLKKIEEKLEINLKYNFNNEFYDDFSFNKKIFNKFKPTELNLETEIIRNKKKDIQCYSKKSNSNLNKKKMFNEKDYKFNWNYNLCFNPIKSLKLNFFSKTDTRLIKVKNNSIYNYIINKGYPTKHIESYNIYYQKNKISPYINWITDNSILYKKTYEYNNSFIENKKKHIQNFNLLEIKTKILPSEIINLNNKKNINNFIKIILLKIKGININYYKNSNKVFNKYKNIKENKINNSIYKTLDISNNIKWETEIILNLIKNLKIELIEYDSKNIIISNKNNNEKNFKNNVSKIINIENTYTKLNKILYKNNIQNTNNILLYNKKISIPIKKNNNIYFNKKKIPNWNITYTYLNKNKSIKNIFKTFDIFNSYNSFFKITDIELNLLQCNKKKNIKYYNIDKIKSGTLELSNKFEPFFGFNALLKNNLKFSISYNKNKNFNLSFHNNSILEKKNDKINIETEYIIKNIKFKINNKIIKLKNNINLNTKINIENIKNKYINNFKKKEIINEVYKKIEIRSTINFFIKNNFEITSFYEYTYIKKNKLLILPKNKFNMGLKMLFTFGM